MIQPEATSKRKRRSIKLSSLASKHKSIMRAVYKEFQAMFFSLYGPSARWETVHRESNALLLIDAARKAFGERSTEFRDFSKDVLAEMSAEGDTDMRLLL